MLEATCDQCSETFCPADEQDLIHLVREDGRPCGGPGRITGEWHPGPPRRLPRRLEDQARHLLDLAATPVEQGDRWQAARTQLVNEGLALARTLLDDGTGPCPHCDQAAVCVDGCCVHCGAAR